ncbi:TIGR03086 family metal-binding protein [Nocardioides sp.]|uniref:TIGR03086 family metal-binding protein n=1 Tax=Nocardioides sp. TaxID=35761 RepID=UPI003D14E250
MSAASEHRVVTERFGELVSGTTDWDAPAPVEGWVARDVVRHLVEWLPPFLETGAGIALAKGPSCDEDPVAAWRSHAAAVQALLDDPATSTREFSHPRAGNAPLADAINQFYTTDVFLHTWDLARATGQDETLDPEKCAMLVAGMEPYDELLRSSGQYGPRVEVPDDADPQTRLIAFIGRDPR